MAHLFFHYIYYKLFHRYKYLFRFGVFVLFVLLLFLSYLYVLSATRFQYLLQYNSLRRRRSSAALLLC